ncbi:MAG: general secretion pathway protein GspK [Burkholderiales bacterium]|nr:MAG: general secretion pathway protein GspK [Burkholderiales bacterium]
MLTLTLVATLAAGAAWQQWRGVETERAERERGQAGWLLVGALDWARLILREDARSGGADHFGEPWAVALQESRLSSFLAADATTAALMADQANDDVFLSGQIQDLQARMNVYNLIEAGRISPTALAALAKLFDLQGLDIAELNAMAENLRLASDLSPDSRAGARASLLPQRVDQLTLLGLSSASLERLRPFITWLPNRTPINVNTASAEVLYASVPALELAGARKIVSDRQSQHFRSLADVGKLFPALPGQFNEGQHSVASRFFEVTGRLRLADGQQSTVVMERSVVQRDGLEVKVLWRERGSFPVAAGGSTVDQLLRAPR